LLRTFTGTANKRERKQLARAFFAFINAVLIDVLHWFEWSEQHITLSQITPRGLSALVVP
jgi:hypothetical protein